MAAVRLSALLLPRRTRGRITGMPSCAPSEGVCRLRPRVCRGMSLCRVPREMGTCSDVAALCVVDFVSSHYEDVLFHNPLETQLRSISIMMKVGDVCAGARVILAEAAFVHNFTATSFYGPSLPTSYLEERPADRAGEPTPPRLFPSDALSARAMLSFSDPHVTTTRQPRRRPHVPTTLHPQRHNDTCQ
jgi:hypothetical protein